MNIWQEISEGYVKNICKFISEFTGYGQFKKNNRDLEIMLG